MAVLDPLSTREGVPRDQPTVTVDPVRPMPPPQVVAGNMVSFNRWQAHFDAEGYYAEHAAQFARRALVSEPADEDRFEPDAAILTDAEF
jgi:hypothetical protein